MNFGCGVALALGTFSFAGKNSIIGQFINSEMSHLSVEESYGPSIGSKRKGTDCSLMFSAKLLVAQKGWNRRKESMFWMSGYMGLSEQGDESC